MPQFTIDGVQYEYEGKHKLLQFALDNGVDIPYFCYHPSMSAPTNCRMCLVEVGFPAVDRATREPILNEDGTQKINWGRKPATSCSQDLAPNMIVKTHKTSETIKVAQESVLEFMLINHPLDCPVCDQAGECPLQINSFKYGPTQSRFEVEKVHKPKKVALGPNVVFDAERCINCTRCVRFTQEISKTDQLYVTNRGDKNYIVTAPGEEFDDAYSLNTVDICPVGALTSRATRFEARVWEMNYTPSICTSCAKGCSTDVWVTDNEVIRQTARENLSINDYWLCDEGRLNISKYNENRVNGAKTKGDIPTDKKEAYSYAAKLISENKGKILYIASAHNSLEDNYVFKKFATQYDNSEIFYHQAIDESFEDDFLKNRHLGVNEKVCQLLEFTAQAVEEIKEKINSGEYNLVIALNDTTLFSAISEELSEITSIAFLTNHPEKHESIDLILPAANTLEASGTFINIDNVGQIAYQAKQIKEMTPEMWMMMSKSRLDAAGMPEDNWRNTENIIDAVPSYIMLNEIGKMLNMELHEEDHHKLFLEFHHKFEAVEKLTLLRKLPKERLRMRQDIFAIN